MAYDFFYHSLHASNWMITLKYLNDSFKCVTPLFERERRKPIHDQYKAPLAIIREDTVNPVIWLTHALLFSCFCLIEWSSWLAHRLSQTTTCPPLSTCWRRDMWLFTDLQIGLFFPSVRGNVRVYLEARNTPRRHIVPTLRIQMNITHILLFFNMWTQI